MVSIMLTERGLCMAIHYRCRHCKTHVGSIDHHTVNAAQLGFETLSNEERQELLSYKENGEIEVTTTCEDCQDTLERNPEYHTLESFIQ
jgi:Protein of unknown function (DUF2757)